MNFRSALETKPKIVRVTRSPNEDASGVAILSGISPHFVKQRGTTGKVKTPTRIDTESSAQYDKAAHEGAHCGTAPARGEHARTQHHKTFEVATALLRLQRACARQTCPGSQSERKSESTSDARNDESLDLEQRHVAKA
jgi:hypothetical protein